MDSSWYDVYGIYWTNMTDSPIIEAVMKGAEQPSKVNEVLAPLIKNFEEYLHKQSDIPEGKIITEIELYTRPLSIGGKMKVRIEIVCIR